VILADTHIWLWWVGGVARLSVNHRRTLEASRATGVGVSVISCWEVAKLVQVGKLALTMPVTEWLDQALAYPGIRLVDFTPRIAVGSTRLPGTFHRDPADQILVATAREYDWELVTVDQRILAYPHVRTVAP
jgi:PIN domain nuclease of toxin-antitoxin system